MPVLTAAITQHGPNRKGTEISREYAEPRYAVRITFAAFQQIWMVSHEDCIDSLPAGASVLHARLLDEPLPNINRNAGFDTGVSTITAPTYRFVDVDNTLSNLLADKNVNGQGSFNRIIEEWEFEKGRQIYLNLAIDGVDTVEPKFTGIIQDHSKPYNIVEIETADINRGVDEYILDPLEWRLATGIDAKQDSIQTTLPVAQIEQFQATFQHKDWYDSHPSLKGGYAKIEDEIFWYTAFEAVNGVSTFTGVERGVLRSENKEHTIEPNTEDSKKPLITEITLFHEPATDIPKMLITGKTSDGRQLPAHWAVNQPERWINYPSFSLGASSFKLKFTNYGKVKCRDFYQKEVLVIMGAVLTINGYGKLTWTPRARPIDSGAGGLVFDPSNCVDGNDLVLRHIKTGIHPSFKINYDHDHLTDKFLSRVTYRDIESEVHNNISDGKKVKEFEFKGLHAGIHTGTQLQKLAATFGDDYFYEKQSLTIESRLNNLNLGRLVTVDFPSVIDDANGTAFATPLIRTMLIVASNYNRAKRTTTYTLSGSLYIQSTRQASQRQHNLEIAEYKRGKINLATLPGISISPAGNATGSVTLEMGKHYYYVNDDVPGQGLEFSAALNVTLSSARGGVVGLHVFGPFVNKTSIDLTAKSHHEIGVRAAAGRAATNGIPGYALSSRSSGALGIEEFYSTFQSSDQTVYTGNKFRVTSLRAPNYVTGRHARAPDPVINVNNGLLGGVPSDLGGTSGPGSDVTTIYDPDRRPQSSPNDPRSSSPETITIEGSNGGRGGGGMLIVSWGGGIQGSDGEIILNGGNAQTEYTSTLINGAVIHGSRGGPGMPGSLLWIVDGNHSPPILSADNVKAFPGLATITGSGVGTGTRIQDNTHYKSPHGATPRENLFQSVVRIAYTPDPETVQELPLGVFSEFFTNQRDGKVDIFVGDFNPSNANQGDMRITEEQLNSGLARPEFWLLTVEGWRKFDYATDNYATIYLALIANRRDAGGDTMISQTTRPVGQSGNLWHNPNTGNIVRLLDNGPPDQLVFSGEVAVGANKYLDGYLTRYKAGEKTWVFTDDLDKLPTFPPEKVGGLASTGTGNYPLSAPSNLVVTVYSSTTVELIFNTPATAQDEGITGYQIRQNGVLIDTVTGGSKYITGLSPATSYTFAVRSINGYGARSAEVSDEVITQSSGGGGTTNTLNPVTGLNVQVYSASALELFWTTPSDKTGISSYQVRRDGNLIGSVPDQNSTSYFDSTLNPSTTYTYTVRSINATERSNDVSIQATTPAPPPP